MAKGNLRPIGDKVIVKRLEADERTAGGILLPDSAKEKPKRGIIQSVGDGKMMENGQRSKPQIHKNQEVLFTSYAGTEVKINGEELLIMEEADILGILN